MVHGRLILVNLNASLELSKEQIEFAYPKSTQTIEIETFVKAGEIDIDLLVKPYYLEPSGKAADKVYALLRESMR
ncbi:MAG: hypothetical protein Q8M53_10670 [Burkholderiales bacterium]|nr:hypothetical protein [Burkholderiales bacterium]